MGILMRNGINYSGSQLPSVTTTDEGKVLTVNGSGVWTAQEVPNNIADVYDSTLVYNAGDCCMFEGVFYQCNTDSTTGTWDSSKWDPTTVFQSVSDGKELIADAITDKGVPTSATDTFQDMADNIAQISSIEVVPLTANENKTYTAEEGTAYSPVTVAVEPDLTTKSITANGIYKASDDDADGYSEVTVNVSGSADHAMLNGIIDKTATSVSSSDVTSIGQYAFYSCSQLTTTDFPKATSIGQYAFYNCSQLRTADFPKATSIGNNAFQYCRLKTADLPEATSIGNNAFCNCPLITADFPKATSIGSNAFRTCAQLRTFEVASTVTSIGSSAFYNSNLATITMRPTTPPTLSSTNAFTGLPNDYVIYVPNGSLTAYQTATNWSSIASHIVEMQAE